MSAKRSSTVKPQRLAILLAAAVLVASPAGAAGPSEYDIDRPTGTVPDGFNASWSAPNPAHHFDTFFAEDGIWVTPLTGKGPAWEVGLSVVAYGWLDRALPVRQASVRVDENRIEFDRGVLTEWYINDTRGLEQGFTLRRSPAQTGSAAEVGSRATVVVTMEVAGDLLPRLTDGGESVDFFAQGSRFAALRYTDLKVRDADGRPLAAHLGLPRGEHADPTRLRIVVDTTDAVFPIEVDPLLQSAAWFSIETDETWAVAWGDWDGDGDLDLAVGNYQDQPNRVYENQGGSFAVVWTSPENDDTLSAAWGDWDNDGDLDLAVGSRNTPNRVYENTGGALALAWSSPESDDTWSLAWGDWDADGDLDLAVGNRGSPNRVYRNTGGALTLAWSSSEFDATSSVAWGDWNGDGDLDLAVGNLDEANRVYENSGGALALAWSSPETDYTRSVAWGDWDNDGNLDLAAGNTAEPSRVYGNTGGGLSLVWSASETDSTYSIAWGDWDDDGDQDLAAGNVGMPNRVWENDAGTLTLAWSSTEPSETRSIAWGDWDNDGDLDLAAGNNVEQPNRVYENTGGLRLAWSSTESESTRCLAWGDWDGDGDLDLAVGSGLANRVYENTGGALVLSWSSSETDSTQSVAWGDWDGDGDLDLAVGNASGQPNRVYENTGGSLNLAWSSTEIDTTHDVAWGDWDSDGDLDLAVGSWNYPNRVYENIGGGLTLAWSSLENLDRTTGVAWGDWDGDGDLDLAVGNMFNQPVRVYENVGGALALAWSSSELHLVGDVHWVDWDGDGDLDLAAGGNASIYENAGGSLSLAWSGGTGGIADWGDWDGDGDLDVAMAGIGASVEANTGGSLEAAWSTTGGTSTFDMAWGDWDGDGDLDLAVAADGPNLVYENGRFHSTGNIPETPVFPVATDRPGSTANAYAYSTPERLSSPVTIDYSLYDEQSDPAWLVVPEYSLQGGGQWLPATQAGGDPTTGLATSPAGTAYAFVWDAEADGVCSDNASFRIRVEWQAPDHAGYPVQRGNTGTMTPPFRLDCPMWYRDQDGDGHGDPAATQQARSQPGGYIAMGGDCDDTAPDTFPGAPEINDGLDNQCPSDPGYGVIDETSGDSGFHNPADKTEYSWLAQTGATSYEVARSTLPNFSADCVKITVTVPVWNDTQEPAVGGVFYYLNRPLTPNAGSWGQDSTGAERTGVCP